MFISGVNFVKFFNCAYLVPHNESTKKHFFCIFKIFLDGFGRFKFEGGAVNLASRVKQL